MVKKSCKKLLGILLLVIICLNSITVLGHSGRTDAYGGHKDNRNVSGLGPYHYHCGGHPAHLHSNGVCPYSSTKMTAKKKKTKTTVAKSKSTSKKTVKATSIHIDDSIKDVNVGDIIKLEAIISPCNVTNKSITWKSLNEDIAKVKSNGEVEFKKEGSVYITANTNNNKYDSVKFVVSEKTKPTLSSNIDTKGNNEDSDTLGYGVLGLCGAGVVLGMANKKKRK